MAKGSVLACLFVVWLVVRVAFPLATFYIGALSMVAVLWAGAAAVTYRCTVAQVDSKSAQSCHGISAAVTGVEDMLTCGMCRRSRSSVRCASVAVAMCLALVVIATMLLYGPVEAGSLEFPPESGITGHAGYGSAPRNFGLAFQNVTVTSADGSLLLREAHGAFAAGQLSAIVSADATSGLALAAALRGDPIASGAAGTACGAIISFLGTTTVSLAQSGHRSESPSSSTDLNSTVLNATVTATAAAAVARSHANVIVLKPNTDTMHNGLTVSGVAWSAAVIRQPIAWPSSQVAAAAATLAAVGLSDAADTSVSSLSREQKQRLSIAVELAADPAVVFADNATAGLAPPGAASVMRALAGAAKHGGHVSVALVSAAEAAAHEGALDSVDTLLLLAAGGRTIYSGPRAQALHYFLARGWDVAAAVHLPPTRNLTGAGAVLPVPAPAASGVDATRINAASPSPASGRPCDDHDAAAAGAGRVANDSDAASLARIVAGAAAPRSGSPAAAAWLALAAAPVSVAAAFSNEDDVTVRPDSEGAALTDRLGDAVPSPHADPVRVDYTSVVVRPAAWHLERQLAAAAMAALWTAECRAAADAIAAADGNVSLLEELGLAADQEVNGHAPPVGAFCIHSARGTALLTSSVSANSRFACKDGSQREVAAAGAESEPVQPDAAPADIHDRRDGLLQRSLRNVMSCVLQFPVLLWRSIALLRWERPLWSALVAGVCGGLMWMLTSPAGSRGIVFQASILGNWLLIAAQIVSGTACAQLWQAEVAGGSSYERELQAGLSPIAHFMSKVVAGLVLGVGVQGIFLAGLASVFVAGLQLTRAAYTYRYRGDGELQRMRMNIIKRMSESKLAPRDGDDSSGFSFSANILTQLPLVLRRPYACVQFASMLLALHALAQGVTLCITYMDVESDFQPWARVWVAVSILSYTADLTPWAFVSTGNWEIDCVLSRLSDITPLWHCARAQLMIAREPEPEGLPAQHSMNLDRVSAQASLGGQGAPSSQLQLAAEGKPAERLAGRALAGAQAASGGTAATAAAASATTPSLQASAEATRLGRAAPTSTRILPAASGASLRADTTKSSGKATQAGSGIGPVIYRYFGVAAIADESYVESCPATLWPAGSREARRYERDARDAATADAAGEASLAAKLHPQCFSATPYVAQLLKLAIAAHALALWPIVATAVGVPSICFSRRLILTVGVLCACAFFSVFEPKDACKLQYASSSGNGSYSSTIEPYHEWSQVAAVLKDYFGVSNIKALAGDAANLVLQRAVVLARQHRLQEASRSVRAAAVRVGISVVATAVTMRDASAWLHVAARGHLRTLLQAARTMQTAAIEAAQRVQTAAASALAVLQRLRIGFAAFTQRVASIAAVAAGCVFNANSAQVWRLLPSLLQLLACALTCTIGGPAAFVVDGLLALGVVERVWSGRRVSWAPFLEAQADAATGAGTGSRQLFRTAAVCISLAQLVALPQLHASAPSLSQDDPLRAGFSASAVLNSSILSLLNAAFPLLPLAAARAARLLHIAAAAAVSAVVIAAPPELRLKLRRPLWWASHGAAAVTAAATLICALQQLNEVQWAAAVLSGQPFSLPASLAIGLPWLLASTWLYLVTARCADRLLAVIINTR